MKLGWVIAFLCGCCLIADAGGIASSPMVVITGGIYQRPLEKGGKLRTVSAYQLDVRQATNAEFLAFVTAHPEWRRSQVNRLFADRGYLTNWANDVELGPFAPPDSPVVNVSWHAARAFLKSVGKRLPTVDEWEFAARADEQKPNANHDPVFKAKILDWYSKPTLAVLPAAGSQVPNFYGVRGMHGIVWEWTRDFVSAMTSGEARSDGTQDAQLFCGGGGADPNQATEYANFMRVAFRSSLKGDFCLPGLGFRGAKDAVVLSNSTNSP
ncbi:MAG: formylglycine-generating enzyme family protein [Verrucomicrobiota bacterium]